MSDLIRACFAFVATAILFAAPAGAGFLDDFQGYSVFGAPAGGPMLGGQCPVCDSTVTFAVWENTDGNWLDDFPDAIGFFGDSDGSERYVYLYQVVGTNPLGQFSDGLEWFNVTYGPEGGDPDANPFIAGGYFDNTAFANVSLDVLPLDWLNDGIPSCAGGLSQGDGSGIQGEACTFIPGSIEPNVNLNIVNPVGLSPSFAENNDVPGSWPVMQFLWVDPLLDDGQASPVLFLTSNLAPGFAWAETESPPSNPGPPGAGGDIPTTADRDSDGVVDWTDNCLAVSNATQLDVDADGYGNRCDTDLDNNCFTNYTDVALFGDEFGAKGENAADFDGSLFVNFEDLDILGEYFGAAPGPSALTSTCD